MKKFLTFVRKNYHILQKNIFEYFNKKPVFQEEEI